MNKFEWFMLGNLFGQNQNQQEGNQGSGCGTIIIALILWTVLTYPLIFAGIYGAEWSTSILSEIGIESDSVAYIGGGLGVLVILYLYWKIYRFFKVDKNDTSPWIAATTVNEPSQGIQQPINNLNESEHVPSYEEKLLNWGIHLASEVERLNLNQIDLQISVSVDELTPKQNPEATMYQYGVNAISNGSLFFYTINFYYEDLFIFSDVTNGARNSALSQIINTALYFKNHLNHTYPHLEIGEYTKIDVPEELFQIKTTTTEQ